MQRVKIADIEVTKGKGEKGDWTKTTVVAEDGGRFSGFDTKLANLTKGSVIDIEPEIKGKYINIKEWKMVSEAVAGQPVVTPGGRQYGKSPEELQLSRRSFALSYAKDLAVAKLIEVKDILTTAENYYRWMGEGTISIALKTTPKVKEKPIAQKIATPAPDIEQAEQDSKELFPTGGSEGLNAEEAKGEVPKTQEQLFNYVAKHAGHKDTTFTKAYLINKFKIPEKRIDEDIVSVYYEVKAFKDWPEYDGE